MSDLALRIVVQQLESLQRMGVCQLGKRLDAVKGPQSDLEALALEVSQCTKCTELAAGRTQTVFGVGHPRARLCFFGEAPGADEDRQGEPFVGRAGQLLNDIIRACTLQREQVYILNVLKCRPPGNRNPQPDEISNCRPFFEKQLELIQPEFICCLGAVATGTLLGTSEALGRQRGRLHAWRTSQVLVTYHPAYLLRNPAKKRDAWNDMQLLMRSMGIEIPAKTKRNS
jgi:DNA polymerase